MTRFLLLTTAASLGLALLLSSPEVAQAQTPRTDTIKFMAATPGVNFDGTGLKWCTSKGWHQGIPGSLLETSLDEVPQSSAGDTLAVCPSSRTEQVELAAYGSTNDAFCTPTSPCFSLRVGIESGTYLQGGCTFIEAKLYDFGTANDDPNRAGGNFRGRERMLHAIGPSGYLLFLSVASGIGYSGGSNWISVGTVFDDVNCWTSSVPSVRGYWPSGSYHVHHDFMPPTVSATCQWNKNTSTNFATGTTNLLETILTSGGFIL